MGKLLSKIPSNERVVVYYKHKGQVYRITYDSVKSKYTIYKENLSTEDKISIAHERLGVGKTPTELEEKYIKGE